MKITEIILRDGDRYSLITEWDGNYFLNLIIGRLIDVDKVLHYSKSKIDLFQNVYYINPGDLKWRDSEYPKIDWEYSPAAKESMEKTPWDDVEFNVDAVYLFANALNQTKVNRKVVNVARARLIGSWSDGVIGMKFLDNGDFHYRLINKELANKLPYKPINGSGCNKYKFGPWHLFYFNDTEQSGIRVIVLDIHKDFIILGGLGSGLGLKLHKTANESLHWAAK